MDDYNDFFYSDHLRQNYSMWMKTINTISLCFPKNDLRYGQELLTIRSENPRFKFTVHNYEFVWVQNNIIFEETLPIPVIKCIIDYKIDPLFWKKCIGYFRYGQETNFLWHDWKNYNFQNIFGKMINRFFSYKAISCSKDGTLK